MSQLTSVGGKLYADGVEVVVANSQALATAWVRFNATGAIVDSYNVTSVTRNAVGKFSIVFATAMDNANYLILGGTSVVAADTVITQLQQDEDVVPSTTGFSVVSYYVNAANNKTYRDQNYNYVVIHGGKA